MQQVTTLKSKDGKSLIEWRDGNNVYRTWVPVEEVKDGKVENPERGISYGDDLVHSIEMPITEDLQQALHNQGLWTLKDMAQNPQQVLAALSNAYSNVVTQLLLVKED